MKSVNLFLIFISFLIPLFSICFDIEKKDIWSDEIFTHLVVQGVDLDSIYQNLGKTELSSSTHSLASILDYKNKDHSIWGIWKIKNIHPPIYFFVTKIFSNFFPILIASRLVSAISMSIFVLLFSYFIYQFTKNKLFYFFILLMSSFSSFVISYGQEGRPTALAFLFAGSSLYFFYHYFLVNNARKFFIAFSVFMLLALLTSFINLYLYFVCFACFLLIPKLQTKKKIIFFIIGLMPSFLALIAWFPIFKKSYASRYIDCCKGYLNISDYMNALGHMLSFNYLDLNIIEKNIFNQWSFYALFIPLQLICFYFFWRKVNLSLDIKKFFTIIIFGPFSFVSVLDLFLRWHKALIPRFSYYFFMGFFVINILALFSLMKNKRFKVLGYSLIVLLCFCTFYFRYQYHFKSFWWTKHSQYKVQMMLDLVEMKKIKKIVFVRQSTASLCSAIAFSLKSFRNIPIDWQLNKNFKIESLDPEVIYVGLSEAPSLEGWIFDPRFDLSLFYKL